MMMINYSWQRFSVIKKCFIKFAVHLTGVLYQTKKIDYIIIIIIIIIIIVTVSIFLLLLYVFGISTYFCCSVLQSAL